MVIQVVSHVTVLFMHSKSWLIAMVCIMPFGACSFVATASSGLRVACNKHTHPSREDLWAVGVATGISGCVKYTLAAEPPSCPGFRWCSALCILS